MTSCKVSIIVPVYNTSKYLEACMESLVNQTLDEIEIIAVNDGSTDNSLEILKSYQKKYPRRVYVYNIENQGVSHARNYGLEKAAGEYIWFVDSDDFVEPDACERLYAKADRDKNDLVLFSRYDVDGASGERTPNKTFHFNQNFTARQKPYEMVKLSPFPWNKFIKKDLMSELRFPEGIRFEDLPISFILFTRAESIGVLNEYLYDYRKRVGFLSEFSESTLDIVKAMDFLNITLEKDGNANFFKTELEFIAVRHLLYRLENMMSYSAQDKPELKKELVNNIFDYLEKNFPEYKSNPYIVYTLPDRVYRLLDFYFSRSALLDFIENTEAMSDGEYEEYKLQLIDNYSPDIKKEEAFDVIKERLIDASQCFARGQKEQQLKNAVLFVSGNENGISSSVLSLIIYAAENINSCNILLACNESTTQTAQQVLTHYGVNGAEITEIGSKQYVTALAASKYVIADRPLEHYFYPRSSQIYINLMTEHISPKETYYRDGNDYSFAAVQRSLMISSFSVYLNAQSRDAFEEEYKVQELGVKSVSGICPAADLLSRGGSVKADGDNKIILIAPQFRPGEERTSVRAFRKFMSSMLVLDSEIKENEKAYLCLDNYPFNADMSMFGHISLLPEEYDMFDAVGGADVVVTNYHHLLAQRKHITAETVRYITDEKRFIDDSLLGEDSGTSFVCDNPKALADYLHTSEGKTNAEKSEYCKALFDIAESGNGIYTSATDSVKLFYFAGGRLSVAKIKEFNAIAERAPHKCCYIAFDEGKNPKYENELLKLLKKVNYIPIRYDTASGYDEKIISSICSKGKAPMFSAAQLQEQKCSEKRKYFGNTVFDEMILLSVGEIERNLTLTGASPKLTYSFNWFSGEKYKNKKAFKCKVDYICRELEGAQKVIIPQDMKELKAIKKLPLSDSIFE